MGDPEQLSEHLKLLICLTLVLLHEANVSGTIYMHAYCMRVNVPLCVLAPSTFELWIQLFLVPPLVLHLHIKKVYNSTPRESGKLLFFFAAMVVFLYLY